jgi:hypothetical protein
MAVQEDPNVPSTAKSVKPARRSEDFAGGAALGLFLGTLMGLTATPVVTMVVTALVALLAGVFGLADKLSPTMAAGAARRLIAFGIAATVAMPTAIWVRTHDVLSPSIEQQKQNLQAMGITDPKEQKEMMQFLRFGISPAGSPVAGKEAVQLMQAKQGILYAMPSGFCDSLFRLKGRAVGDYVTLFGNSPEDIKKIGRTIESLPANKQIATFEAASVYLCAGS